MTTSLGDARRALRKAGMSATVAKRYLRTIDLDEPVGPQIAELVEGLPELFGFDEDGNSLAPDPDDETPAEDEDDERPMTAAEAKRARLNGVHRLTPSRSEGSTPAERNALALGAGRARRERPSSAPATAQAVADRLRVGLGSAVDDPSS